MDRQIKTRLGWVSLYLKTTDAGYVCAHCGVSRPTLRKWVTRYQKLGIEGLKDLSKRPKSYSNSKTNDGDPK
jgi:transposase